LLQFATIKISLACEWMKNLLQNQLNQSIFFFKQKKNRGNPLHYPKYIKHKKKDNTTNWGDINLTQLTFFVAIKDNTIKPNYKWF
jgi:hypothetical protein